MAVEVGVVGHAVLLDGLHDIELLVKSALALGRLTDVHGGAWLCVPLCGTTIKVAGCGGGAWSVFELS